MIVYDTQVRTRYGEVDMMGFFYHAHYVELFETGRTELMRHIGFSYAAVEALGVMMPVLQVHIDYKNPAHYDDTLTIRTTMAELPRVKVKFDYEVFRGDGDSMELITTGSVTLAFMHSNTHRPTRCPQPLLDAITAHFNCNISNI